MVEHPLRKRKVSSSNLDGGFFSTGVIKRHLIKLQFVSPPRYIGRVRRGRGVEIYVEDLHEDPTVSERVPYVCSHICAIICAQSYV